MSYDFLLFKLTIPIQSPQDLSEASTTSIGTGDDIQAQLTALFPDMGWHLAHGYWWGRLDTDQTWYEFCVQRAEQRADIVTSFSIHTSHRAKEYSVIHQVCQNLNLVAFDGQTNQLIGELRPPTDESLIS